MGNRYSPFENQQWTEVKNDAGSEIPPFGVMRLTGMTTVDGRKVLTAEQSNTYGAQYGHAINSPCPLKAGRLGACTCAGFMVALYDSSDGTPASGELWGPRNATWKLKKNTGGFRVLGVTNSSKHLVLVTPEPFLAFLGRADSDVTTMAGDVEIAGTGQYLSVHPALGGWSEDDAIWCERDELNQRWVATSRHCGAE